MGGHVSREGHPASLGSLGKCFLRKRHLSSDGRGGGRNSKSGAPSTAEAPFAQHGPCVENLAKCFQPAFPLFALAVGFS